MKKYMLLGLLLLCIVIWGCEKTNIKKDEQCKNLLDNVIEKYYSEYEDFDLFYSKKYDTCITTYKYHYYGEESHNEIYEYVIEDVMNDVNSCSLTWNKDDGKLGKWKIVCRWWFSKLVNRKLPYTKETDKFGDILDWYNKILDKLK